MLQQSPCTPARKRSLPLVGSTLEYVRDPLGMMRRQYDDYGPVSEFGFLGKRWTVLLGPDACGAALQNAARSAELNGVGARGFREAFPACDVEDGTLAAWGTGPALHAHQIVLEVLSETGIAGLLLWLAGAAMAWRAWRYADDRARGQARPAMLALAVTLFPLNTHLAAYSTFWGGVVLLLAALYAGSLLDREAE